MFDVRKVSSVYSGRKGCACGCRGKYSYAFHYRDTMPDYKKDDPTNISDRSVRFITKRVENLLRDGRDVERVLIDDSYIAVDMTHDRTYTIYFDRGC